MMGSTRPVSFDMATGEGQCIRVEATRLGEIAGFELKKYEWEGVHDRLASRAAWRGSRGAAWGSVAIRPLQKKLASLTCGDPSLSLSLSLRPRLQKQNSLLSPPSPCGLTER
jgi:hypothetical protein